MSSSVGQCIFTIFDVSGIFTLGYTYINRLWIYHTIDIWWVILAGQNFAKVV